MEGAKLRPFGSEFPGMRTRHQGIYPGWRTLPTRSATIHKHNEDNNEVDVVPVKLYCHCIRWVERLHVKVEVGTRSFWSDLL